MRLWASVCLALYVAFWLELDNAFWAGTSAAIVCQPHLGASLRKGWFRMIGTVVGAVAIVVLTACFPQDRAAFLVGLALWGGACALVATLLRNFAAYAAALAGYTAAIIAADTLGATGGTNGQVFMLADQPRERDLHRHRVRRHRARRHRSRRRPAPAGRARSRRLSAEITGRFTGTLALAGPGLPETQPVRRELVRRVIALDPVIDEAIGESSQLRYHSPVLQTAVDGLFAALAGWRTVAAHLARLPDDAPGTRRRPSCAACRRSCARRRSAAEPARWMADPVRLHRLCEAAVRTLIALPAGTPSLRLLADQTAKVLAGMSHALNGLALLRRRSGSISARRRGSGSTCPIGCLPSSMRGARSSRSAPSRCFGS